MAGDEMYMGIVTGSVADKKSAEQTGKDIVEGVMKGIGNNGYVKLKPEIAKYKYPKQTMGKNGILRGHDYTQLQKAQDDLISNWNKLSRKGFSSRDEDLIAVLKSFRDYQNEVTRHYGTDSRKDPRQKEPEKLTKTEKQAVDVITHIGNSLKNYFTRLLEEDSSMGIKGDLMSVANNKEFERYATRIIQRHKAATAAGIDLSKEKLTESDMKRIDIAEIALRRKAEKEKVLAEREHDRKHAKQTIKNEEKQLKQIEKDRAKTRKNAIKLEKPTEPLEEVQLSATKVVNLAEPTDYKQTKEDKKEDKEFLEGLSREAVTRANNTPGNDTNLDIRRQTWNPLYSYGNEEENKKFFSRMERGGTYVDTNSLIKQTYQALPEEIKRANKELEKYIDKDKAIKAYTKISSEEAQEMERIENELGISRLLLTNVAKVQGALMADKKGVEPQDLVNAIHVAVADAVEHGKSAIAAENYNKAIISVTNMLMNRYSNMKDRIGSDVRRDKKSGREEELGVGRNYEVVAATLKDIFEGFQRNADELLKRAIIEFPEFYGGTTSSETPKKKKMSTFEKVFAEKLEALRKEVTADTNEVANITEKQGRFDRAEYSAERVADAKEGQVNREINANITEDTRTGMNTEANATKLFAYLETIGSFMDELSASLSVLASVFNPKKKRENVNGGGGSVPPIKNLNGSPLGDGEEDSQQSLLAQIVQSLKNIDVNVGNILQKLINPEIRIPTNALTLIPGEGVKTHEQPKKPFPDKTDSERLHRLRVAREVEEERAVRNEQLSEKLEKQVLEREEKRVLQEKLEKLISGEIPSAIEETVVSTSYTGLFDKIKNALSKATPEVDDILKMNQEQQELLLAKRRKEFGLSNTVRNVTDTGDIGQISRAGFLWRRKNKKQAEDANPFKSLKITPGLNVDYAGITEKLQATIEKNQFKAQTGGGFFDQFFGSMTFYLGQDSIEKSRAQIDGLNEVFKIMKDVVSDLVASIQVEEEALKGMEKRGEAVFTPEGGLEESSTNEAFMSAARMEELKLGLQGVLAEVAMTDNLTEALGGNVKEILNRLGFVAPELQKCNKIIKNVNSGLDKNGKALKFQRRTQEIMNYSYQLMARHIGQIVKTWIMALNPVRILSNVVKQMMQGIRSSFQDFANYDVKWKRTMNVIKYNFRVIIRPAMQWIAQSLTNVIGFLDKISMKIQEAFGKTPISLFDQAAADAEKMREELEEAANVTAGFDELHDISGETAGGGDPAMDLMGDIYKPQLSEDWIALAEKIGDVFGKLFTGDMGFGEAMDKILALAWEGIQKLWGMFKKSKIGQMLIDAFKTILDKLLQIFVGWQLLKIAGKLLWNALFGKFTTESVGGLFGKLGKWLSSQFLWVSSGGAAGQLFWTTFAGKIIQGVAGLASVLTAVATIKIAFDFGANEGKQTAWGEQSDAEGALTSVLGGAAIGAVGGAITGGLAILAGAATTVFLPIVAGLTLIAGVVSLIGYNVSKSNEEFKIQQGLLMDSEYYALKLADANDMLEVQELRTETQQIRYNKSLEKAKELFEALTPTVQEKYGGSLEKLIEKTDYGTTMTGNLTTAEQALKEQLTLVKGEMDDLTEANKKLTETKEKILKLETLSQIAADVEAEKYELAATRIELAVEQGVLTVEQGSRLMQGAFDEASKAERDNMLLNMEPELRAKFLAYLATTKKFQGDYISYYQQANYEVKKLFDDPSVTKAAEDAGTKNAEALFTGLKKANLGDRIAAWWRDVLPGGETSEDYYRRKGIAIPSGSSSKTRSISIASFDIGTNYVPNDGLAYLHQGEAVIPKKYNQPYSPEMSASEQAYMERMMNTMKALDNTMKQGIKVNGQFTQRGSDLVAVVNRVNSQTGSNLISDMSYAR